MPEHPIYAGFYEVFASAGERQLREHREATAGRAGGRVLEIGAGNGLNFSYYPAGALVIALDPEPTMLKNAGRRAGAAAAHVVLVRGSAERLPFRDGAFDTIVATLALCSIPDAGAAARETRRVLAAEGELRFFEHVRSRNPRAARRQDRWDRAWGWFSGGCHPNRDTVSTLREAGFTVGFRRLGIGPRFAPVHPHVVGVARSHGP